MSGQIRLATAEDTEQICHLLHAKMNNRIPVDRWRNLMSYAWLDEKPDFGRVVESGGQILGFCGMLYSDRLLGSSAQSLRKERMVSMSSWYLDKSLRGKGLGRDMLISAVSDPSLTYSTLTNSKKPLAIVEALGFKVLERQRYIWKKSCNKTVATALNVVRDPIEIAKRVSRMQRQLLDDMHGLPLTPVLLTIDHHLLFMFFSVKSKGADVIWFDLMYASDLEVFSECAQLLADRLLPDATSVLAADSRFVKHASKNAVLENLPVSRYFISSRVEPDEIDHLYSELQLLDLKLD